MMTTEPYPEPGIILGPNRGYRLPLPISGLLLEIWENWLKKFNRKIDRRYPVV
jgi:hypothetical protein